MTEVTVLGKLLKGDEQRDAIHIAVAPVVAGERLHPGQHIGFSEDKDGKTVVGKLQGNEEALGIVDPFLPHFAEEGESFWMFLTPYTITSLRHNWTHPAFEEFPEEEKLSDKEASEKWLKEFIKTADCPDYERLVAAAVGESGDNQWDDDYLHFNGVDAHGYIPPEFWDHIENVTGKKVDRRPSYFSCGC